MWLDEIAFFINRKLNFILKRTMFDNVGGSLQDGTNLDSAIHKEAETKKKPDHGDLWKLSYRY